MNIHLETERFLLRDIEEMDVQGIFDLDSDPEVQKYLGQAPMQTIEEAEAVIRYIRQQYVDNGIGRWAIIDKKTHDFIGWTGLKYEDTVREDFNYYDLGYRLQRKYWGQGIGTETALASIRHGFQSMRLAEISGAADLNNIGSNKILRKVGLKLTEVFEFEGVPHNWYSLSREEWLANSID